MVDGAVVELDRAAERRAAGVERQDEPTPDAGRSAGRGSLQLERADERPRREHPDGYAGPRMNRTRSRGGGAYV